MTTGTPAAPGGPLSAELRAWRGRRVLLTGHTGFKGGWLALWLAELGAEVTGYALAPDTDPSLFAAAGLEGRLGAGRSILADVRDAGRLVEVVREVRPDAVLHLAAQALVRRSYQQPVETLAVNALGTAHLLEAVRAAGRPCAVVVVTSDKCYEGPPPPGGHREADALGGHDVYSMSKGAAELVAASWRRSFFDPAKLATHGVAVATARAGNVLGGGDWAADRLVPDAVAALAAGRPVPVRNPDAVRPWQHVLEPLSGYLLLGARLLGPRAAEHAEAWNFGPRADDAVPVRDLADLVVRAWGEGRWEDRRDPAAPHEAAVLRLDTQKAADRLGWAPRWRLPVAVARTVDWYRAFHRGAGPAALAALCRDQIHQYLEG